MMTTDLTVKESELKIVYGPDYLGEDVNELSLASVKYIYTDLTDIRKYYIRLGFHLNEFDMNKGYLDFGYNTLEDFCAANIGMDKSAVSRCINVYREFNAGDDREFIGNIVNHGCAMDLSDRWKNYSYTQLVEMLPLSPEDRMKVLPSMSCKEIREFKKKLKDRKKKVLNGAVASTQQEESGSGSVVSTQSKRFNYDECFKKSGIVQQNYIKSCDYDEKEKMPAVYLYDCNGKRIIIGSCGCVLERVNNSNENRIVIRMTGYCYEPVELKEN
ncbi:MAG: hypothetical protein K2O65_14465 [Lachnospiraceae bacterium]|nr:hypothetical protein [Lachnospiraceae bacterium]